MMQLTHKASISSLDLLKLANYYCETKLRSECETLIKQSITIKNAARLYASAIQYNAKVGKLMLKYVCI
jgi:hypothetical protein